VVLDAQGAAVIPITVPPAAANLALLHQAFVKDLSNGMAVWFQ
jgi:hypothetical protein